MRPPPYSNLGNKQETNKWEGRDAHKKTWTKWKQAYLAAYAQGINRQRAGATDELFTRAANNSMLPAMADVLDALTGLLDNLALAATSNKTAIQHLTVANLALTTSVSTLVAANKKLTNKETLKPEACTSSSLACTSSS